MNGPRTMLSCLLSCIITGFTVYWVVAREQKKIAVIDAIKLFNAFTMKNELEGLAKGNLQAESKQLDSIGSALQMTKAMNSNEEEVKKLSYAYSYMNNKLDDDYAKSNEDINTQVWKRLNPLIAEFGKKTGVHLIIGANGMGSVLYTDQYYDLTSEAIQYINKRYAEGN
jgi:outer membrane protein